MRNLKKEFTLEDIEWGEFPVRDGIVLEGESEIVERWRGQTPTAVLKLMAIMYLERFADYIVPNLNNKSRLRNPSQIWAKWIVGNGNSWQGLDRKLKEAANLCADRNEHIAFWDKMRHLARRVQPDQSRSMRRSVQEIKRRVDDGEYEVVLLEGKQHKITEEQKYIFKMGVCRYCWRAAFKIPGHQWCHCHLCSVDCEDKKIATLHNNKVRAQYSKSIRKNDLYITSDDFMTIYDTCNPSTEIEISVYHDEKLSRRGHLPLQKAWEYFSKEVLKLFPHVSEYLTSKATDLNSTRAIIEGLEYPPPKAKESPTRANVRNVHYLTCSFDYATAVEHLVWAEIWLKYQSSRPSHGGVRKGAGRPRKE